MRYIYLLFAAALLTGLHCIHHATPPTLVLRNGVFFTADSLTRSATAVAVVYDHIVYVGDENGIEAYIKNTTKVIDLNGAFVMPGLIEGHGHFNGLGKSLIHLNLLDSPNWSAIVAQVAEKVAKAQPGEWIEGRGWHQEKWNESPGKTVNGYPFGELLDQISPQNPVVLYHASGHALMANAKAMELSGVSGETADPAGGRIVRDAGGRLTGVFEENAMNLIDSTYIRWKNQRTEKERQADFDRAAELAARECHRLGITSFQDAGSDWWETEQYERLARSRQLGVRLWAMILQPKPSELERLSAFPKIGVGQQFLTVRSVKAYLDGALGSYGAWLLAPYQDKPDTYGQNVTPIDSLKSLAQACKRHGLQFCVHAIGDRANREVLDVMRDYGAPDLRWRIEHAQHVDTADQPRFRELGVIASIQAIHCTSDALFFGRRLGPFRARTGAYVWRSFLDKGARIANGTDTPVEKPDPLPCLYAAVTRKRTDNGLVSFPEQCMSREEALLSYTLWNAFAAFEEREKGSISVGKLADFAVFSKNLLTCTDEELLQAEATMTIIGGKVAYVKM